MMNISCSLGLLNLCKTRRTGWTQKIQSGSNRTERTVGVWDNTSFARPQQHAAHAREWKCGNKTNRCGQHSEDSGSIFNPKHADVPTLCSSAKNRNIPGQKTCVTESFMLIIIRFFMSSHPETSFCEVRNCKKKKKKGSLNLFSLIVCSSFQEMPGQLGDPVEISGAKGTADVTVSRPRTLPLSLSPFASDTKKKAKCGVWFQEQGEAASIEHNEILMEVQSSEKLQS